jgi:hypothetical protein
MAGRAHEAALDMLGSHAVRSPEREQLIAERERACGVTFPAAVVEWFALEGAEELFEHYSNEDRLTPLEELGDPEDTRQGYLEVAIENQAVVAFYVRLDEGDDPPVYDNNDEFGEPLDEVNWNRISQTFTNFIFDMVSIARLHAIRNQLWFEAEGRPPADAPAGLRPGPETRTAEGEVRRFYGPHELVRARWAPGDEVAHWYVEADTPERLAELAEELGFAAELKATQRSRRVRRRRWWHRRRRR